MDESEKTTKKRRRVTIWRVFFFLLLIVVVAFAVFRFRLRSKLNARIEAIRAAGYPMTSAELNAWYTIPHGAENGQAELAVRSILSAFGLARSLAEEPIFGAQMVLNRLGSLTLDALERIVNKIELSDEQMAELTESINSSEHAHDILRGFVGWQCMFLGFVKDPTSQEWAQRVLLICIPPGWALLFCVSVNQLANFPTR